MVAAACTEDEDPVRRAAPGTAAGTALATSPTGSTLPPPSGAAPVTSPSPQVLSPLQLFANPVVNAETLFAVGGAAVLASEVGEMMRIAQTVNAATGNPADLSRASLDAYVAGFGEFADRLDEAAAATTSRVTRRQRLQRSSQYTSMQLFFVLGTSQPDREAALYAACADRFARAAELYDPPAEPFSVRSEFGEIPGYFFRPSTDGGRRPTVIISNGSDGQHIDILVGGLTAALDRGYNVAIFEGPGQMRLLFEQGKPFTPDWQKVVGPVFDRVKARDDVGRVGLIGISFGGMLCARAAADVKGLDAVVLEPAAYDAAALWKDQDAVRSVRSALAGPAAAIDAARSSMNAAYRQIVPTLPFETQFEIAKRGEIYDETNLRDSRAGNPPSDYFGMIEAMLRFDFTEDYRRIRIPTMLTQNEGDEFFGDQPEQAFALLTGVPAERKELLRLTAAQGAQLHDQPSGPTVAQEFVFDWLDRFLT